MILPQSSLSRLTLAALATLLGQVGVAHAAPVVGSKAAASVIASSIPGSLSTDSGYSSSSAQVSDRNGRGYGYSFANAGGAYAVSTNAAGIGSGSAHAEFANSWLNDSGVAQHYTLSFHIYGGYISVANVHRDLEDTEQLIARYSASIKTSLNSSAFMNTAYSSAATLTRTATGSTLTRSNLALLGSSDDVSDHYYDWGNAYYTVDLGIVAAGDTINVLAEVDNSVTADVGIYDFNPSDCGSYGNYCYGGFAGQASSFYGDPIALNGLRDTQDALDPRGFALLGTPVTTQDLPEPASLALVGLAVGAAGLARRKRKQGDGE